MSRECILLYTLSWLTDTYNVLTTLIRPSIYLQLQTFRVNIGKISGRPNWTRTDIEIFLRNHDVDVVCLTSLVEINSTTHHSGKP